MAWLPNGVIVVELSVPVTADEFMVPVTAEDAFEPNGVIVVELSVPVTADVAFVPVGVTVEVPIVTVPVGVTVWVCVPIADPVKVGWVKAPAAIVGTPAGHEIAPSVNAPALATGTLLAPVGHATVPAGVKAAVELVPVAVSV